MKKVIIYSAVFGHGTKWRTPELTDPNTERVCFTDLVIGERFWKRIETDVNQPTPPLKNRFIKICIPPEIFDNYEYSLYMDTKHPFNFDLDHYVRLLGDNDLMVNKHPRRDCIYEEAEKCIELGKGNPEDIRKQVLYYKKQGYPAHNGLYAAWGLFRRHTPETKRISRLWWEQVSRFSHRDQISLPYIMWEHNIKVSIHKRMKK